MLLPPHLARQTLLQRGAVLKSVLTLEGERKLKFILVISTDSSAHPLCALLPTSQVESLKKVGIPFFIIPAGTVEFFPLSTGLALSQIHYLGAEALVESYLREELEYIGLMPSSLMSQIDLRLAQSHHLSRYQKRLTVPSAVLAAAGAAQAPAPSE